MYSYIFISLFVTRTTTAERQEQKRRDYKFSDVNIKLTSKILKPAVYDLQIRFKTIKSNSLYVTHNPKCMLY